MLFVQSLRGLSHNPLEDTEESHLLQAIHAFHLLTCKTLDSLTRSPHKAFR